MSRKVPSSVSRNEFNQAVQPLLELLGLSLGSVYADCGIVLLADEVCLTVAAEPHPPLKEGRQPLLTGVEGVALAPSYDAALSWRMSVKIENDFSEPA